MGSTKQELFDLSRTKDKEGAFSQVLGLPPIERIAAGAFHFLAEDREGHLWSWGSGERGQLGLGDRHDHETPQRFPLSHVHDFALGGDSTLILQDDSANSLLLCGKAFFNATADQDRLTPLPLHKESSQEAPKTAE